MLYLKLNDADFKFLIIFFLSLFLFTAQQKRYEKSVKMPNNIKLRKSIEIIELRERKLKKTMSKVYVKN